MTSLCKPLKMKLLFGDFKERERSKQEYVGSRCAVICAGTGPAGSIDLLLMDR